MFGLGGPCGAAPASWSVLVDPITSGHCSKYACKGVQCFDFVTQITFRGGNKCHNKQHEIMQKQGFYILLTSA